MKTLFIDWSNLLYRCLYVAYKENPFDEKFDQTKRMVFHSLFEAIKLHEADELVVCGDGKNPWRKEIYKEYKQGRRSETPIDFDTFLSIMNEFWVDLASVFKSASWIKMDDVEADDIVAILTKAKNNECVCSTADKDYIQLLSCKNFKLYNPMKRCFIHSLNPEHDLQLKLICGDKSDNIKGIKKGIGPKTAEKLLKENELYLILETEPSVKDRYVLNKRLIDMNYIPAFVVEKIKNEYRMLSMWNYKGDGLFNFVMKHVPNELENMTEIDCVFGKLKHGEIR